MREENDEIANFFERILQILEHYGIKSIRDLAINYLGYNSSEKINRLKKDNTNPSYDILVDISNRFDEIDANWLITGKGEMLKDKFKNDSTVTSILQTNSKKETRISKKIIDTQEIPLYDLDAAAGLKLLLANRSENIINRIKIPCMPKCDGAISITGDSMYPLLKSGDIVLFKQINNINYIIYGDMYILSYEIDGDEYLAVKYVQKSNKEGYIRLVSYNQYYDPIDIPISSVNAIAMVQASIWYNCM